MSAELELRLLLAVCAILYITGFVQLCIERSSYREAKRNWRRGKKNSPNATSDENPCLLPAVHRPAFAHMRENRETFMAVITGRARMRRFCGIPQRQHTAHRQRLRRKRGNKMPIVINRNTGAVKSQKITQEQRDALWGELVWNYIRKHPEALTDFDAEFAEVDEETG